MLRRLVDAFKLDFTQDDVDFAIPRLDADLPLWLDPFLLWSSGREDYQQLHERLVLFLDHFGRLAAGGRESDAVEFLMRFEEPREAGLGYAAGSKRGSFIGPQTARVAAGVYANTPQLQDHRLEHVEELGLLVPRLAEDRISDLTVVALRGFFTEFTERQAKQLGIPTRRFRIPPLFDPMTLRWQSGTSAHLPFDPDDESPLLFLPLDLLRHLPWINYPDYYRSYYARHVLPPGRQNRRVAKEHVLAENRSHFEHVQRYVRHKEATAAACTPDPLFTPLTLATLTQRAKTIDVLATGGGKDALAYENAATDFLRSALYPELEFSETQVRTVSGAHIRDLMFYNDAKTPFMTFLRDEYDAQQLVFELKNVAKLETEHVNQLYRYLGGPFGRIGVMVSRNPPPRAVVQNIIDLHSSKRHAVVCLDDRDLALMLEMLRAGRRPIDVLKKKFVEFTRALPS